MIHVITNNNLKSTIALATLQNIIDPEIELNIVDLGLIYQLDFDEEAMKIYCAMTLTSQFCPLGESITNSVKEQLKTSFPDYVIELELTFNPPWSHAMISEEGRKFLNKE